jgi:hypothetical protein
MQQEFRSEIGPWPGRDDVENVVARMILGQSPGNSKFRKERISNQTIKKLLSPGDETGLTPGSVRNQIAPGKNGYFLRGLSHLTYMIGLSSLDGKVGV